MPDDKDVDDCDEMDMEASLKLGGGCASLFRFACTLCSTLFTSYVNLCRHRRLVHGRFVGICSSSWLVSRKTKKTCSSAAWPLFKTVAAKDLLAGSSSWNDLFRNYPRIAQENLNHFICGKRAHIRQHSVTTPSVISKTQFESI